MHACFRRKISRKMGSVNFNALNCSWNPKLNNTPVMTFSSSSSAFPTVHPLTAISEQVLGQHVTRQVRAKILTSFHTASSSRSKLSATANHSMHYLQNTTSMHYCTICCINDFGSKQGACQIGVNNIIAILAHPWNGTCTSQMAICVLKVM